MREARDPASHGGVIGAMARGMSSRSDLGDRLIRTFPACNYSVRVATEVSDAAALSARLGRLVRAHRAGRGMSLAELARAAGLSKTILARIERGEGNPSIDTLWRLHRALEVPLGALLAEDARPARAPDRPPVGRALSARTSASKAWRVHDDGRDHRGEVYELHLPAG